MSNALAIGLYSYSPRRPGGDFFRQFYELALGAFQTAGVAPTYFAAEGVGYNGSLTKWGGRTHSKAIKSDFSGIHVMSLVANPAESSEPGYDSFASASLSYVEETGETLLCVMMEERFLKFGGEEFERLLESLLTLAPWDFGYALSQPVEKKPEFHVLGLDGGAIGPEDRRRLTAWYASMPEERLRKLRDVYPYLVINKRQLQARVSPTQTLEDIARSDTHSVLTHRRNGDLWIWKIRPNDIDSLRDKLHPGEVLIT